MGCSSPAADCPCRTRAVLQGQLGCHVASCWPRPCTWWASRTPTTGFTAAPVLRCIGGSTDAVNKEEGGRERAEEESEGGERQERKKKENNLDKQILINKGRRGRQEFGRRVGRRRTMNRCTEAGGGGEATQAAAAATAQDYLPLPGQGRRGVPGSHGPVRGGRGWGKMPVAAP